MSDLLAQLTDWLHAVFVEQFSLWVLFGFIAQTLFFMRFLVQWLASERAGRSVVPPSFWLFSIGGGTLLLIYAVVRGDPVFIAGQAAGLFVYVRNIVFVRREKRGNGPGS